MPVPSNTTIETATPITLLAPTVTQNVHDSGTTYTVWYRYTADDGDVWMGIWGMGDLTTYQPTTSIWLGPTGAPTEYLGMFAQNVPMQFPVTGGVTYYFKVTPNGGNPTPASLTLSLVRGPQLAVPAGSIAVNDDHEGFPLVLISTSSSDVLNCVSPFPAGEAADILPSGVLAVANGPDSLIEVYDADYTLLGSQAFSGASDAFGFIRAHHASDTFFVLNNLANTLRTITAAGAFGPTTWTLGSGAWNCVAVNQAADRAYLANTATNEVRTWNLGTDADDGLFVAYPTSTEATDILVLADDTVLIAFCTTDTAQVIHYSTAAAVLHTYSFTGLNNPGFTLSRLAMAIDDPDTFWIWTHHNDGESQFREIRISDGVAITTVNTFEFEFGCYQAPPVLEPVRFGHSYSCPFWITRTSFGNGGGGGGGGGAEPPYVSPSYFEDPRIIRRLRRAPHVSQENVRVFYRKIELDLERGVGLATGQGEDPLVMLRLSRDGGHTWSEPLLMSAGRIGVYTQRVIARRLGQARDTVFEVTVSDPVAWSLVNAWLDLEAGTS